MDPVSFVTLSRTPSNVERLRRSIDAIGLDAYELIVCDGMTLDIFCGYNDGAHRATHDNLCFVHDDVEFWCNRLPWEKAVELVRGDTSGFPGVAGTTRLAADATWWNDCARSRGLVVHTNTGATLFGIHASAWPGQTCLFERVAVVDGVLMVCRKDVFEGLSGFDTANISGFHCYDVEISFRCALAGRYNYSIPVPTVHHSRKPPGLGWDVNRELFPKAHAGSLPYEVLPPTVSERLYGSL